jgi:hypothetical protein
MKFERDKGFERLVKIEKGKNTGRIEVIVKRHIASEKLSPSLVKVIDNKTWAVTSSDNQREYIVEQESEECDVNCAMRCDKCDICIHMYCCNSADALIHHSICKHIHLVAKTNQSQVPHHSKDSYNVNMDEVFSALQSDNQGDLLQVRQKIMKRCQCSPQMFSVVTAFQHL